MTLAGMLACIAVLSAPPAGAQDGAGIPADTYGQQLGVRLYGAAAQPDLFAARVAIHEENADRQASSWAGSMTESELRSALGGGLEVSYGFLDDVKFLVELGGFGSSASATFTGFGANSVVDPVLGRLNQRLERVNRYSVFGQNLGATVLLRSFEWCRFGLTFRLGACELAGAVERSDSSGPLGTSWWNRTLSGSTAATFIGLEWEWLSMAPALGLPVSGYATVGYRQLRFSTVKASYTDSAGTVLDGDYTNADGTRRALDFSGPEARIGLQIGISFAPTQ